LISDISPPRLTFFPKLHVGTNTNMSAASGVCHRAAMLVSRLTYPRARVMVFAIGDGVMKSGGWRRCDAVIVRHSWRAIRARPDRGRGSREMR
jgi:hypothetical protein